MEGVGFACELQAPDCPGLLGGGGFAGEFAGEKVGADAGADAVGGDEVGGGGGGAVCAVGGDVGGGLRDVGDLAGVFCWGVEVGAEKGEQFASAAEEVGRAVALGEVGAEGEGEVSGAGGAHAVADFDGVGGEGDGGELFGEAEGVEDAGRVGGELEARASCASRRLPAFGKSF